MKFAMPMVKDFVPKAVRPWLYVVMALCFQVSAALSGRAQRDYRRYGTDA